MKRPDFEWAGLHPFSHHPFVFEIIPDLDGKIAVDCGCGKGVYGYLIRATRPFGKKGKFIGIDINENRLNYVKFYNIYDKRIKSDITKLPLKSKSVDFLICSEVIEHLPEKLGAKFIKEVNRVMRPGGRAIITTPNIDMDTLKGGADAHASQWSAGKFKRLGFRVRGVGLRLPHAYGKWYTKAFLALSHTFSFVGYTFPSLSGYLIAYKDF